MKQGWMNVETGETGTFDKNKKPRPYTLWEKVVSWVNRPNYNNSVYWEYFGTGTKKNVYINLWTGRKTSNDTNITIYINKFLKRAKTSDSDELDYNALTKHKEMVFLDN